MARPNQWILINHKPSSKVVDIEESRGPELQRSRWRLLAHRDFKKLAPLTQERKSSDHAGEASGAPPAYCLRAVFVLPETQHALVDAAVLSVLERGPRAFLPAVYVFFLGSP